LTNYRLSFFKSNMNEKFKYSEPLYILSPLFPQERLQVILFVRLVDSPRVYNKMDNHDRIKTHRYSGKRIIHDSNQLTDPSQLKIGGLYRKIQKGNGKENVFEFLEFIDKRWIKIKDSKGSINEISLADMGIVPYSTSKKDVEFWNSINYILPHK